MSFLIVILTLFFTVSPIRLISSSSFNFRSCSGISSYYDPTSLACSSCGSSVTYRIADNTSRNMYDSPNRCICLPGYKTVSVPCDLTINSVCSSDNCVSCLSQGLASTLSTSVKLLSQPYDTDVSTCIPCGNSTLGLDTTSGECLCPVGYALTETLITGELLSAKECYPCPNRTQVFLTNVGTRTADPYTCQSCGNDPHAYLTINGDCECDTGYTLAGLSSLYTNGAIKCIPQTANDALLVRYPLLTAASTNYYSIQSTATGTATGTLRNLVSVTFSHLFTWAGVGCRAYKPGSENNACQTLANLCVLQFYDPSASVCSLYAAIANIRTGGVNSFANWPVGLPFLYWNTELPSLLSDTTLSRQMEYKLGTIDNGARTLAFYLAKYTLNGTFLGMERLRNQLSYCAGESGVINNNRLSLNPNPVWAAFGHNYNINFKCDVRLFTKHQNPLFYELYVRDLSIDSAAADTFENPGLAAPPLSLYPVPVRIVNYRTANGNRPNDNSAWSDENDDILTSRFTLVDAVSGIRTVNTDPEVIRYASRINLYIASQLSNFDKIAPPVLTIEYHERTVSTIMTTAALTNGMAYDTLNFSVEYASEYSRYSNTIVALGASLGVLVALWASLRITAWIRMNSRSQLEATLGLQHVTRWVLYIVTSFAFAFFWYLVIVTGWWLAYFKLQDSVYSLLPPNRVLYSDNAYHSFRTGIWFVMITYIIRLAYLLYRQVTVDVFFIDWEKSRGALFRSGQDVEAGMNSSKNNGNSNNNNNTTNSMITSGSNSSHSFTPVSAWRSIFAANEWAELSIMRRTHVPLTLLILVTLLEGGRLKFVATPQPYVSDLSPGDINPALQFANNVFWYFIIVVIQLLYNYFIGERYVEENPTTRYIDLVTVMKISLLLMDEKYHGYYIHGNAPHEHSDGGMAEIANHLFEEAAAARVGRGLPGCPDPLCQTFELHVPALWREQYDRVFRRLLDSESAAIAAMNMNMPQPGYGNNINYMNNNNNNNMGVSNSLNGGVPISGVAGSLVAKARERTRRLGAAQQALSSFMKGFIEETDPDYKRVWRDRTLLQAAFDVPPDMLTEGMVASASAAVTGGMGGSGSSSGLAPSNSRLTYVYTDHLYRFERLIFRGIEFDLLIFEILLFCLVDYLVVSPTSAGVTTYIFSKAIATLRHWWGNRNVSYKTLVDERFLL